MKAVMRPVDMIGKQQHHLVQRYEGMAWFEYDNLNHESNLMCVRAAAS